VGVARALAADPDLLLFDEPFGALDPVTRVELQDQFLALRREYAKTSVLVTHDVREAVRLGSRIAVLAEGQLIWSGTPQQFLASDDSEIRHLLRSILPLTGAEIDGARHAT
jgi:osmoprotectant transport system ATP-binding protein